MAKPDWSELQGRLLSCSEVECVRIMICGVLSDILSCYGATTAQILAIYEIFPGRMSGLLYFQHIEVKGKQ